MIKITKLHPARKHLVTVELSNGEELVLDDDFAAEAFLKEGDSFSEEEIERLVVESERKRAVKRGYYYLSLSDYSSGEMSKKLQMAKFSEDAAEYATQRIKNAGYINDERYALQLAERYSLSGNSKREAVYKICNKQIPKEIAEQAVESIGFDDEALIERLLAKKYADKLSTPDGSKKVFAALMRKGFHYEDIKSALNKFRDSDFFDMGD